MKTFSKELRHLGLLFVVLFLFSNFARGGVTLDQEADDPSAAFLASVGEGGVSGSTRGQSFTVGLVGTLDRVEVLMADRFGSPDSDDILVSLVPGNSPFTTPPVATTIIPFSSVPFQTPEWLAADFSAANIAVNPGEVYTIWLASNAAALNHASWWGGSLNYDGGHIWVNANQPGNTALDFSFRTYVLLTTETPTGFDISLQPPAVDGDGNPLDEAPVVFTFDDVTTSGETTVVVSNSGEPTPLTFKLGNPPIYYNLETTASFSGNIELCINYSGAQLGSEANARLLHFTGSGWEDVTISLDIDADIICGITTSLSSFVVVEPAAPEEMITGLMFQVMSINLRKGIANALDAKLDAASNALVDTKQYNYSAAINLLVAFINSVEAQRGKELSDDEANELIASAEEIITTLGQ